MKIRIVALVSMLAIGASVATAQAPAKEKDKDSEVKGNKKWGKHEAKKGDRDDDRNDDRGGQRRGWGGEHRLLGGIELTDAQKTSIKAIHAKYEPQQKAIRDTLRMNHKADMKPSESEPLRTRAQTLMTQERAEIRTVLTPEQQVRFDQNVAKFGERRDGRDKRGDRGNR
jgi:Spy/CpxP family protein refolding chaperone